MAFSDAFTTRRSGVSQQDAQHVALHSSPWPDWSGCVVTQEEGSKGSILCHERLAIVGISTGAQPLVSTDGKLILAVNGEIYNHRQLRKG